MEDVNQPIQAPDQMHSSFENHNSSKVIPIIIGAIILILVGAGSYVLGTKKSQSPVQKACTMEAKLCPDGTSVGRTGPKCEFSPCPTLTSDPTSNWKTYENTKYGYSIKVPPNYSTAECMDGKTVRISFAQQGLECQTELAGLGITIYSISSKNAHIAALERDYEVSEVPITVDGILGVKLEGKLTASPAPLPNHMVSSYFERNNQSFFVEYYDYDNNTQATAYSQILSTFKFTDQNQTIDPTANWKTYANNGISFRYPPDWKFTDAPYSGQSSYSINSPNQSYGGIGGILTNGALIYDPIANKSVEANSSPATAFDKRKDDIINSQDFSQNGIEGTIYKLQNTSTTAFVFLTTNKNQLVGLALETPQNNLNTFELIFDQILSTFQFTP